MVSNKRAPLVCLSFYVQQIQAFLKAVVVRSSKAVCRFMVESPALKIEKHHGFLDGVRVSSIHQLQCQFKTAVTFVAPQLQPELTTWNCSTMTC